MTHYHIFIYNINDTAKNVIFYCTDTSLLDTISIDMVERFGAAEIDGDELDQTGEMAVFFRKTFDMRFVEHYINQLLCMNGWEPFSDYSYKLRYED